MPNNRTNPRNPTVGKPKFHARRYWRSQLNPPRCLQLLAAFEILSYGSIYEYTTCILLIHTKYVLLGLRRAHPEFTIPYSTF